MHKTAMAHAELFFRCYRHPEIASPKIVEIGSLNINGSIRQVAPAAAEYIGLDFSSGDGVDLILEDPYHLPVADSVADIVVSSSCFEHAQFFWLTFLEALRILKPHGLLYINVPSNGWYHRHPTDNWRFYPDAGLALTAWAAYNQYVATLLESFIGAQDGDVWNDFVAVFLKDRQFRSSYQTRMHISVPSATNIIVDDADNPLNVQWLPQDIRRSRYLSERLTETLANLHKM